MALSNWDTLAVDLKGKSMVGLFTSPLGVTVEIYKNWIYVRDKKAWRKGGGFMSPVVMEMHQGILHYQDVEIEAIRGLQNGVYLVCYHVEYPKEGEAIYTGMIGCGVYGYKNHDWVGVTEKSLAFLQKFICEKDRFAKQISSADVGSKAVRYNQGDAFFTLQTGVSLQATPVGKSKQPHLVKLIKGGRNE